LSDLYLVFACLFSCTAFFVSISQVIGCEDRLRKMTYTVSGGALNSAQPQPQSISTNSLTATGRYSASKNFFSQKKIFYAPLPPEKYVESIGEIRF